MSAIVIADAGGTSTSWAIISEGGETARARTEGFNAVHDSPAKLSACVASSPLAQLRNRAPKVWFYGAGCRGAEALARVREGLEDALGELGELRAHSDMLGAARALCGHGRGIACILGTGSNSCLCEGGEIVANTPSLGYILGDEGGGASIGRRFLGLLFKGHMPAAVAEAFRREFPATEVDDVIRRVYREPGANSYLASFMPFIASHSHTDEIHSLLTDEFRRFVRLNLLPYSPSDGQEIHFTGSVACHFEPFLREALEAEGLRAGTVVASPLEGLISYHTS